jgi:hypothetical protein
MTTVRPFDPFDVVALDLQDSQQGVLGIYEPRVSVRHGTELAAMGPAWTVEDTRGRVLASAGFAEVFGDRQATAWALFGKEWWQVVDRRAVLRAIRIVMAGLPYARIEALARAARPEELRFLRHAGFAQRAVLEQWGPRSETVVLFDRIGSTVERV